MLTLSTLTLFVRDLCLIRSSAVAFIYVTRPRAHAPRPFSLPYDGQLFASRVSPESLCTKLHVRSCCLCNAPVTFCLDRPRFRMSTANFPPRRHFTRGTQVCLSEHFAAGYATYARVRALLLFFFTKLKYRTTPEISFRG